MRPPHPESVARVHRGSWLRAAPALGPRGPSPGVMDSIRPPAAPAPPGTTTHRPRRQTRRNRRTFRRECHARYASGDARGIQPQSVLESVNDRSVGLVAHDVTAQLRRSGSARCPRHAAPTESPNSARGMQALMARAPRGSSGIKTEEGSSSPSSRPPRSQSAAFPDQVGDRRPPRRPEHQARS
jgi:hypothetical protein